MLRSHMNAAYDTSEQEQPKLELFKCLCLVFLWRDALHSRIHLSVSIIVTTFCPWTGALLQNGSGEKGKG